MLNINLRQNNSTKHYETIRQRIVSVFFLFLFIFRMIMKSRRRESGYSTQIEYMEQKAAMLVLHELKEDELWKKCHLEKRIRV